TPHQLQVLTGVADALLELLAPLPDDPVLAIDDGGQIDVHGPHPHSQAASGPRDVRRARAGDHRLGRRAARVEAGSAQLAALHEHDLLTGAREPDRKRNSGLPASDDDHVDLPGGSPPSTRRDTLLLW